jgi:hypothetical protein
VRPLIGELGNTFDMYLLWNSIVFTTEPQHIKIILSSQSDKFEKGAILREQMFPMFGKGLFTSDGEAWKHLRTVTRPFFSVDRVSHFDTYDRLGQDVIAQLKMRLGEGYAVDFQEVAYRFSLDSAMEYLFGRSVNSLKSPLSYPHNAPISFTTDSNEGSLFSDAFREAQRLLAERIIVGPAWKVFELFGGHATKRYVDIISAYVDPVVNQAIAYHTANPVGGGMQRNKSIVSDEETFLDYLVRQNSGMSL